MANNKRIAPTGFFCIGIITFSFYLGHAAVAPVVSKGDSYCMFFWTQTPNELAQYGYYGITKITNVVQSGSATTDSATFTVDGGSWWQNLVANTYAKINLSFDNTIPDSIDLYSTKFAAAPWLWLINGATDLNAYSIRFYFPVLPVNLSYSRYDYFTVKFNDSMDIHFQGISDSIFTGSFINKRVPGSITKIYAKNAITIQTTSANALRIRSIQVDGTFKNLVSSYLGFDLSSLKTNAAFYGFTVVDTVPMAQVIQVKSVALSQTSALFADSTYRLTWSLVPANVVDRCSLYVSLDSGITWAAAGMANGADTSVMWTAPHRASQHCFIKILAIALDGTKYFGLSPQFTLTINTSGQPATPPPNNYVLRGTVLAPGIIRLAWSVSGQLDTAVHSVGIRYNTIHFPTSMTDSLSSTGGIFGLADTCDTIQNLQQNQLYYFSLFVANASGVWSTATQNSVTSVRTGTQAGLAVAIGIDTQYVFGDSLEVWNQPQLLAAYPDTIDVWNGPLVKPGFIQTGPGFAFRQGTTLSGTKVDIAIAYGAIPSPYTAADQRLYQYNIYTGGWRINQGSMSMDTVNHRVRAALDDARLPFIVMIDTAPPVISRSPSGEDSFAINQRIVDTFYISDNIENVSLRLLGGAGNQDLGDISAYITPGEKSTQYLTTIPPYVADQCSGLRAFLIVGDGRNTEAINLSKRILRQGTNCDDTIAPAFNWTPLMVTAQPQDSRISTILLTSADKSKTLAYDTTSERIIQWLPLPQNVSDTNKWVEYSSARDSLFKLAPGKLFWIKSRNTRALNYGNAVVPSLTDTSDILLNANGWTDFSIPYKFDLYLGDIINATRATYGNSVDSIEIYHWVKTGQSYITTPVFLPGIFDTGAALDTIHGGDGYSAFTPLLAPQVLRIPPMALAVSSATNAISLSKKSVLNSKNVTGSWCVRISISTGNGGILSPVYCASAPFANEPRFYPMPPSFSSLRAGVVDQRNGHVFGSAASGDLSQGGTVFPIICENGTSAISTVIAFVEKKNGLPREIRAGFITGAAGAGAMVDSLSVLIAPLQKSKRYFVVGNAAYVRKMIRLLGSTLSLRTFAVNRSIRVVYSVPYNTIDIVLTMYDLRGRRIWEEQFAGASLPTTGSFLLSNPIACGYYIIEMKAMVQGELQPHLLRQKAVYVR